MKREVVYLMVLAEIESEHTNISDTVHELETESVFNMSDTPNVKILITELLLTRVRNPKTKRHGSSY